MAGKLIFMGTAAELKAYIRGLVSEHGGETRLAQYFEKLQKEGNRHEISADAGRA